MNVWYYSHEQKNINNDFEAVSELWLDSSELHPAEMYIYNVKTYERTKAVQVNISEIFVGNSDKTTTTKCVQLVISKDFDRGRDLDGQMS